MASNIFSKTQSAEVPGQKDGFPSTNLPKFPGNVKNAQAEDEARYSKLLEEMAKVQDPAAGAQGILKTGEIPRKNKTSWSFTTTEWQAAGNYIEWFCNPSDVTWTMTQRSIHVKNMLGTVLHVWPDSTRGTFYDEFVLSMRFQSGNIMPRRPSEGPWLIAPGLSNFYAFLQLVDAPKLTADGRINLVEISYKSNIFSDVLLRGMFDSKGISFSDDSSAPNEVKSWSADFIVYDCTPPLTNSNLPILLPQDPLTANYVATRLNDPTLT